MFDRRLIALFLVILCSGSIFYVVGSTYLNILLLIFLPFLLTKTDLKEITGVSFFVLIFYCIHYQSANLITHGTLLLHFIYAHFLFKRIGSFEIFNKLYVIIVTPIMLLSLVGFIISIYLPNLYNTFSFLGNSDPNYQNFLIFFKFVSTENRNLGIFWEPGAFVFFIYYYIIALELNQKTSTDVFYQDKHYRLKIVFSYIVAITTFSKTLIFILPLIGLYFHTNWVNMRNYKRTLAFMISGIISFNIIFEKIIGKFKADNLSNISIKARLYDFYLSLELLITKPFFGWGYASEVVNRGIGSQNAINNERALEFAGILYIHERGITNGNFQIFLYFGIIGGLLIIYHLLYPLKNRCMAFILIIIVLMNMSEPLIFLPISLLIFFFMKKNSIPKFR